MENGVQTLDEAMERYGNQLRVIRETEERREKQEQLEEYRKKLLNEAHTIQQNQEALQRQLEKMDRPRPVNTFET